MIVLMFLTPIKTMAFAFSLGLMLKKQSSQLPVLNSFPVTILLPEIEANLLSCRSLFAKVFCFFKIWLQQLRARTRLEEVNRKFVIWIHRTFICCDGWPSKFQHEGTFGSEQNVSNQFIEGD